jgi:molybdate transport system substrate-binding protein
VKNRLTYLLVTLLGAGTLAFAPAARAQEIAVLSTAAYKEVLHELLPQFEQANKHKVVVRFSSSTDILKRTQAGEHVDVVILASDWLEKLIQSGKIVPGSRVDLAKSGIGVAVRAGAPRPDITSTDAVKRAVLAARSVGYSGGASGTYMVGLFQRLGIAEEVKAKGRQTPPGVAVGELIARGEVELGFHQVSELLPVAGIDILGPLPPELQQVTVFSSGIHVAAKDPAAARALVQFLASPRAIPLIRKGGMEPG